MIKGSAVSGAGACTATSSRGARITRARPGPGGVGRPGRCAAGRAVRRGPADGPAGGLGAALADGLGGQPARRHVPGLHAAAVEHVDLADARGRQQRGHRGAHPARAPYLHAQGAAGGEAVDRVTRFGGGQGQRGQVRAEPVVNGLLAAQGVRGRAAALGVVEESAPRQPPDQFVDVAVGQVHPAALLAQQRQTAGAVEQLQEASRRGVHRTQRHGVRRCHAELHGVEVAPAAPQRGFHHRMHDSPRRQQCP
ncbi:hypothetical protein GCM10020295_27250 [Streptomyces cinereospinus]